jgi:hypothetical protein
MGKDFQRQLNRLYTLLDALVIAAAYLLAWFVLFGKRSDYGVLPFSVYLRALLFILPCWLVLFGLFGLYSGQRIGGGRAELKKTIQAGTIGLLCVTLILYLGSKNPYIYNNIMIIIKLLEDIIKDL